jgi:hypothetical protein
LERELEEARDLSEMADQFAQAMLQKSGASYRGGDGANPYRNDDGQAGLEDYERGTEEASRDTDGAETTADADPQSASADDQSVDTESRSSDAEPRPGDTDSPRLADPFGDATAYPGSVPGAQSTVDSGDTSPSDVETSKVEASDAEPNGVTEPTDRDATTDLPVDLDAGLGEKRPIVSHLRALIGELDPVSREMLAHYRETGASDPVEAHVAVGGSGDKNVAYSRNRPLRQTGLIEHQRAGRYVYALPDIVRETYADELAEDELVEVVQAVEESFVDEATLDATPWADGAFGTTDGGESETGDDDGVEVLKHEEPTPAEKPDHLHGLDTPDDAEVVESDDTVTSAPDPETEPESDDQPSDGAEILDQ